MVTRTGYQIRKDEGKQGRKKIKDGREKESKEGQRKKGRDERVIYSFMYVIVCFICFTCMHALYIPTLFSRSFNYLLTYLPYSVPFLTAFAPSGQICIRYASHKNFSPKKKKQKLSTEDLTTACCPYFSIH